MSLYLLFLRLILYKCFISFFYVAGSDYLMPKFVQERTGRRFLNNG